MCRSHYSSPNEMLAAIQNSDPSQLLLRDRATLRKIARSSKRFSKEKLSGWPQDFAAAVNKNSVLAVFIDEMVKLLEPNIAIQTNVAIPTLFTLIGLMIPLETGINSISQAVLLCVLWLATVVLWVALVWDLWKRNLYQAVTIIQSTARILRTQNKRTNREFRSWFRSLKH